MMLPFFVCVRVGRGRERFGFGLGVWRGFGGRKFVAADVRVFEVGFVGVDAEMWWVAASGGMEGKESEGLGGNRGYCVKSWGNG